MQSTWSSYPDGNIIRLKLHVHVISKDKRHFVIISNLRDLLHIENSLSILRACYTKHWFFLDLFSRKEVKSRLFSFKIEGINGINIEFQKKIMFGCFSWKYHVSAEKKYPTSLLSAVTSILTMWVNDCHEGKSMIIH